VRKALEAPASGTASDDDWLGFLRPDFAAATGLDSSQAVAHTHAADAAGADVVMFSAAPDTGALFLNVFEHAEALDPGFAAATQAWLHHAGQPTPPLVQIVMDSRQTVYGNRLVARRAFWREWVRFTDSLRQTALQGPTAVREALLQAPAHSTLPSRLEAIVERMASLILTLQPRWRSWPVNPFAMPWSHPAQQLNPSLSVMSDALKRAYRDLGYPCYMQAYNRLRERLGAGA
jgi:hypothetical protein